MGLFSWLVCFRSSPYATPGAVTIETPQNLDSCRSNKTKQNLDSSSSYFLNRQTLRTTEGKGSELGKTWWRLLSEPYPTSTATMQANLCKRDGGELRLLDKDGNVLGVRHEGQSFAGADAPRLHLHSSTGRSSEP